MSEEQKTGEVVHLPFGHAATQTPAQHVQSPKPHGRCYQYAGGFGVYEWCDNNYVLLRLESVVRDKEGQKLGVAPHFVAIPTDRLQGVDIEFGEDAVFSQVEFLWNSQETNHVQFIPEGRSETFHVVQNFRMTSAKPTSLADFKQRREGLRL